MSEDSGADVISDLEEGEIPEFEIAPAFTRKHDAFKQSNEEKSLRSLNADKQWEFEKDLSMSNNSLYTRRSPKSSAKNNVIDYRNESFTQFDSPSSEGECTSEEDRSSCGNDAFRKYLLSKELNEKRSKYLYPFQTTYGTVEDIMTKIDKTLGRNNNSYYKRRRSKEPRYNLDLTNNRSKNSSLKESSPVYLNKCRSNYCKKRRYTENNCDSDDEIWEKKDKTKNFNFINGTKKGKNVKNKKTREYDDVILENKNSADNSKKFKSSKHEKDSIDCKKKEDFLKTRSSNTISRPYEDMTVSQEVSPKEKENVKSLGDSNSVINSLVISSSSKDPSKTSSVLPDIICNNDTLINDKSDKTSEQFSGDDEDIELIKLRLIALTSNKKKSQTLTDNSNENHFNIKSDLEQEVSEFACEYKNTDEFDLEGNFASDANSTSYKTSHNTDIDRSELLLRAEALKTALLKKHKHRIKKRKNSSHITNSCSVLVEKNLENSTQSPESKSDIQNLGKSEEMIHEKKDMKMDVHKCTNSVPGCTKDVPNEVAISNELNKSEKIEAELKLNSLEEPKLKINNSSVLENKKSLNISFTITEDSTSAAFSGVNSNINNIGNKTNDNNINFRGTCSSSSGSSSSSCDGSSSNSNNYNCNNNCNSNDNNNNNNNNNKNNTFKENKLLRKQFKKKRWKNVKKVKNLTCKKSNVKENKNQVNDNFEEDDQKLRTQLLNDLLKKKKIIEDEKKSVLIDKLQTSYIQQTEKIKIKKCKTAVKPQNLQKSKGVDKLNGEINGTPKPKMPEMELQRIIVYLGSDSSDEECVLQNNSKTESVLDSNLNKNSGRLKEKNIPTKTIENKKADYEKSVELLLKEARKRVERKSEEVLEIPTPEAVFNHLPPSQRLEYMRLKQKIAEREKLKKSKKTSVSKSSSENNNSSASKGKKIGEEIILHDNNKCILSQLPNDETKKNKLHPKFESNTENILVDKRTKTENEKKSLDNDVKQISAPSKLYKPKCTHDELKVDVKPKIISINDKLSNKKAYMQSGNTKSSVTELNLKSCLKINNPMNEKGMAKTLLERKKVLALNRLHLEKLKILWKNIRIEKFIEQKYEKEIKRLKTQQTFFELKLNQQKLKIKKLAEESKHIYEVFQKNNKGFDVKDKQKLPEKDTLNVNTNYVAKQNASEKYPETRSNDSGRKPAQSAAKAEETLLIKIEGDNQESVTQENIEKRNKSKISIMTASADELKEYNSPLKTFNNGTEFTDCLRIDPNTIMCQFDLLGKCNDEECNYQHWRANSN